MARGEGEGGGREKERDREQERQRARERESARASMAWVQAKGHFQVYLTKSPLNTRKCSFLANSKAKDIFQSCQISIFLKSVKPQALKQINKQLCSVNRDGLSNYLTKYAHLFENMLFLKRRKNMKK